VAAIGATAASSNATGVNASSNAPGALTTTTPVRLFRRGMRSLILWNRMFMRSSGRGLAKIGKRVGKWMK
jgi:hypothetical protein